MFSYQTPNMTDGRIWVEAPISDRSGPGDILGVYVYSDEEVHWTYQNHRVVGYTITKRPEFAAGPVHKGFSFGSKPQQTQIQVYCRKCWKDMLIQVDFIDGRIDEKTFQDIFFREGWHQTEGGQICEDCYK